MFAALHIPDPELPLSAQQELLALATTLTPDLERTGPGTLLLDLFTIPLFQIDPSTWLEQALQSATALQRPLHLALATTPDLAHLAALSVTTSSTLTFTPEPHLTIQDPSSASRDTLSALPLSLLTKLSSSLPLPGATPLPGAIPLPSSKLPPPTSLPFSSASTGSTALPFDLLRLWGIHSLGDLAALPRQGLAERLGSDVARFHDLLHGKHPRLLTLHRPSPEFHLTNELEDALHSLEPLLFLLHRSLDILCARLAAIQRAAQAIHLTLTFDDHSSHHHELRLPEPSCQPSLLLRPLHTHLDTLTAPSPITAYTLRLTPTLPNEAQHHLFQRALRDPHKFADTLARLQALLSPGHLGTPLPLDSHQPDAFRMHQRDLGAQKSTLPQIPASLPATALPLKRYRPPRPVNVATNSHGRHPHPLALLTGPHKGPITQAQGPYLLSGQWWNTTQRWQRAEWDIQLPNQTLLRLAHLSPKSWQLEGRY